MVDDLHNAMPGALQGTGPRGQDQTAPDPAERTPCEVWTRVMGYHRPVSAFNVGKRKEHADRLPFVEPKAAGGA